MSLKTSYEEIDPVTVYSPDSLFHATGISTNRQEEARASGALPFFGGLAPRYRGCDVADWIDGGALTYLTVVTKKEGEDMPETYSDPEAVLTERTQNLVAKGMPRAEARHVTLRRDPALRRDLLRKANADGSSAVLSGIESIV